MRCALTLNPSAAMRRGLSRTPCKASPNGARAIADRAEAERRDHEYHIIERDIRAPVDAPEMRRDDAVDAGVAVENDPILVGEVGECRGDRPGDHKRIDASGAHRNRPAD